MEPIIVRLSQVHPKNCSNYNLNKQNIWGRHIGRPCQMLHLQELHQFGSGKGPFSIATIWKSITFSGRQPWQPYQALRPKTCNTQKQGMQIRVPTIPSAVSKNPNDMPFVLCFRFCTRQQQSRQTVGQRVRVIAQLEDSDFLNDTFEP